MRNACQTKQLKSTRHHWPTFDSLPLEVKRLMWELPLNTTTGRQHVKRLHVPPKLLARACTEAYGPRHPQSYEQLFGPSSADLGF